MLSSSSDSDGDQLNNSSNELKFIAKELKALPVILSKSQIPKMKKKKDEAISKVTDKYQAVFGKEIDAKAFMKKVNNMKTRLKKKTDDKTGNKRYKLNHWEENMLSAMQGDSNPVITRIQGNFKAPVMLTVKRFKLKSKHIGFISVPSVCLLY